MGFTSNGVLKVSLWLQAGTLLVLTALLIESSAWIGATLTAIGFCFVIIGMSAAHKKRLGYLYCYATLLSAWTLLAVAHFIAILGLIAIPDTWMDPVLVMGRPDSKTTMVAVTALYGVQIFAWCTSLICLACIRMADQDPTLGFEIQSPKRRSATHTIDRAQSKRKSRSSRFFGFRHSSSVAPLQPRADAPETKDIEKKNMDSLHQVAVQLVGQAELASVTPHHINVIEARRVMIHHNYDLGDLKLEKESLSDMLFKAIPSSQADKAFKVAPKEPVYRPSNESGHTVGDTQGGSPTLSAATTLDELENDPVTKDLEAAQSFDNIQPMDLNPPQQQQNQAAHTLKKEQEQAPETIEAATTKNSASSPVIPTRRSSIHHKSLPQQPQEPQEPLPSVVVSHFHEAKEEQSDPQDKDDDSNAQLDPIPAVQLNACESNQITPATSTPTDAPAEPEISITHDISAVGQDDTPLAFAPKSPSIQPLRHHASLTDMSVPSTPRLSSTFFRKRHSSPALQLPKINIPVIPVIVLHPSEEDDEPVRVLTDMDIEYLTTMPPTPLRAAAQPWEEEEEEYFDEDFNDGYDFDDYHHPPYDYGDEEFEQEDGFEQEGGFEQENGFENNDGYDHDEFHQKEEVELPKGLALEGEYDPYALDVSINLAIDLQALEQGEANIGYGYI